MQIEHYMFGSSNALFLHCIWVTLFPECIPGHIATNYPTSDWTQIQ